MNLQLGNNIRAQCYIGMPSACYSADPCSIQDVRHETNMINILRSQSHVSKIEFYGPVGLPKMRRQYCIWQFDYYNKDQKCTQCEKPPSKDSKQKTISPDKD